MKYNNIIIILFVLFVGQTLLAATEHGPETDPPTSERTIVPTPPLTSLSVQLLAKNITYSINDFKFTPTSFSGIRSGSGQLYFEALNLNLDVEFNDLILLANGSLLSGTISTPSDGLLAHPIDITKAFTQIQNISMPGGSIIELSGFRMNTNGQSIDLEVATPTVVQGDYLDFDGRNIIVSHNDICLQDVQMTKDGDDKIDDFEFPIRIMGHDPNADGINGSYIVFDCKGFKEFNLAAEYDFPKSQLKAYTTDATIAVRKAVADQRKKDGKSALPQKTDTVRAYFNINAPTLKSFIVSGSIDAFEVPGVDDMGFSALDVVIDYSDTTNFDGFEYVDKTTDKPVGVSWKGIYIKKISLYLPRSISAFNKGKSMDLSIKDLVYDRGNGISFVAEATKLLNISDGKSNGWGISIDTIDVKVQYNSFKKMRMNGEIYIPVTGKDENISYEAAFGKKDTVTTMNFSLNIGATYTMPFLKDSKLTLAKSSVAGMNYIGGNFEPYADLTGSLEIKLGGGNLPEVSFPELGFENMTLGDIISSIKSGASKAKSGIKSGIKEATGGLDKLAIKAFTFGGKRFDLTGDGKPKNDSTAQGGNSAPDDEAKQQKVGGFPISVKSWKFATDSTNSKFKSLGATISMNFTGKKGGGISGESKLAIIGKVEYAKLMSTTPWKALDYERLDLDYISVAAKVGNVGVKGLVKFITNNPVYGSGVKGGLKITIDGTSGFEIAAVAQFGDMKKSRYFFVDASVVSGSPLFLLSGLDIYGFTGGLYYNMEKNSLTSQQQVTRDAITDPVLDPTPGFGLSNYVYTPKSGYFGLKAGLVMGMSGSPKLLCGDVEFGVEMKYKNSLLSVTKLTIDGGVYLMAESILKRKEAGITAQASIVINLERGLMTGDLRVKMDLPKDLSLIIGQGQASFNLDINPNDRTTHKNYITVGRPNNRLQLKFKASAAFQLNCNAYFMFGEFPEPVPGATAKNGVAFGFKAWVPTTTISFGPIYAGYSGNIQTAGLFSNEGPSCSAYKTGDDYGINGDYLKASLSFDFQAKAGINYNIWFAKGKVEIFNGQAAGSLVAELPRPTKITGKLKLKAHLFNGLVKVNTNLKMQIGDKCSNDGGYVDASNIAQFDAACYNRNSNMYYFFAGNTCYSRPQGGRFKAHDIVSYWPGLPNNLDAACFFAKNDTYYFFKGTQYYRKKQGQRVTGPYGIRNAWGSNAFESPEFVVATRNNIYLFKNGQYHADGKSAYSSSWWGNFYKDRTQAAVYNSESSQQKLYFFQKDQYQYTSWSSSRPAQSWNIKPIKGNW